MYTKSGDYIGRALSRVDAEDKVAGTARFGADIHFSGELTARTLYSPVPSAVIKRLDTSRAVALEGIADVVTLQDVPGNPVMDGRFPVFAGDRVLFTGDALAVVAAESTDLAEKALGLIKVEYERKPGLWSVEQALQHGDAPACHDDRPGHTIEGADYHLRKGNCDQGMAEGDMIIEHTYTTGCQEHAYIETESIVAVPAPFHPGVEIYGCIQNPYSTRKNVATALNLPESQVRIVVTAIGGSFGGKDESVMMMASRCALLALRTGRPVRMDISREESFRTSAKRHPFYMKYSLALKKDGSLSALESIQYCRGGAYNKKAPTLNWRAVVHTPGPYRIPHIRSDLSGCYTNTVYGGSFRGFSGPQVIFGIETLIDEAAAYLDRNPKDFRLQNVLRPGDSTACGQPLEDGYISAPLADMIVERARKVDFDTKWNEWARENQGNRNIKRGIGIAVTSRGAGLGGEGIDTSSAMLTVCKDGSITLFSGHTEMGQGIRTAHTQIAAEALGVDIERIHYRHSDTSITADGGPTVASRGVQSGGRAVQDAAGRLKAHLLEAASIMTGKAQQVISLTGDAVRDDLGRILCTFDDLIDFCVKKLGANLSAQGWYSSGLYNLDHATQQGTCYQTYSHGVLITEIQVDMVSGKIHVDRMTASYEVGRVINPQTAYGQLVGGLVQGVGFALFEEIEEHEGILRTDNFDDYMIPTIKDIPEVDLIILESENPEGPFGAKGLGEIGVELAAPSIGNALFHATGQRLRDLPFNLERVLIGKSLKR